MAQINSHILLDVAAWGARLWPLFLVGLLFLFRHRSLRYGAAFCVLGCFVCFGVASLVGQVAAPWRLMAAVASFTVLAGRACEAASFGVCSNNALEQCAAGGFARE